ncbi:MAG: HD domain-containing protein, partial [archaeon]
MKLDFEDKLLEKVNPLLTEGKSHFDLQHTKAVVHWVKKISEIEGGNQRILVAAAYLHDIGYPKIQRKEIKEIFSAKKRDEQDHRKVGEKLAREILKEFDEFTAEEKEKICKIIRRHGKYEKFEEFDDEEYIFLEADNLGGIDFERVTPTF